MGFSLGPLDQFHLQACLGDGEAGGQAGPTSVPATAGGVLNPVIFAGSPPFGVTWRWSPLSSELLAE